MVIGLSITEATRTGAMDFCCRIGRRCAVKSDGQPRDAGRRRRLCSCKTAGCGCPRFFFVVAEGSWVLRCRCKHKHTDHDAASRSCRRCGCASFHSPWVCNCDHAWAAHEQVLVERRLLPLSAAAAAEGPGPGASCSGGGGGAADAQVLLLPVVDFSCEVNRWDLLRRGKALPEG